MTDRKITAHEPASDQERRALDADELEMANQARNPALSELKDSALSDLISRLRSRRNRARDIADRQGREARAKAAPSGATPAAGNVGTLTKHEYLNAALERAVAEREARGTRTEDDAAQDEASPSQKELTAKAMEMKQSGENAPNPKVEEGGALHPNDPDASDGKAALSDTARNTAPSGALDHAGELPSRERSRTRY